MTDPLKTQIAVLGAGPGGYAAAFMAADLGLEVTLIDLEENPGGACLYRGCIPSKTLLHCAKVLTDAREANAWGITFSEPSINFEKMRVAKDNVVAQLTGGLGQLCKARKIRYIQGRANFEDSTTLKITADTGEAQPLTYEHAILAAGSRPAALPDLYTESPRIMNSTGALMLDCVPKTLLVIGGGYIGLELGSVYAALGTQVSVVEMGPALLPGADADLVKPLAERMNTVLAKIMLNTRVLGIREGDDGIRVTLQRGDAAPQDHVFERVLVSIGRKPNSSGLGLSNTKVEVDDKGFVKVDAQRRSTDPRIFAVGDIAGQPMLAHKASYEGRIVAEVLAGHSTVYEPRAIPAVVFTDPELAWCGLTEIEAARTGRPIQVARFPWGASGRASTLGRPEGLTKVITDPETQRVLGVGIVGSNAGELISQGALAIEMGALASDISGTIHPHPTLSETLMETAEMIFGHSAHIYRPRKPKE